MNQVRITKIFSFEAAHALFGYNGPCRNIHGHSYKLFVTISGPVDFKTGMLLDFSDLKRIVHSHIIDPFDHALVLYEKEQILENITDILEKKILILPFNPTSENLVIHFSGLLIKNLPEPVRLHHLKLYETATSFTEWYAADNL